MEDFWTHQDNIPDGLGFGQFSLTHIIAILVMLLLIVFIIHKYKNSDDEKRLFIRKLIAISLIILETSKIIVMSLTDVIVSNNLPLEICSFAEYAIILDAFLKDNNTLPQMLLYLFFPAALMALIFPTTSVLPIINFFSFHQFLFHALIIAYAFMRFISKEVKINYKGVWKSIGIISAIALCVYFIDVIFDRNFMFLRDTYNNAMLNVIWNVTGGGLKYDGGLVIFSIFVIHIFYFIFKLINNRLIKE